AVSCARREAGVAAVLGAPPPLISSASVFHRYPPCPLVTLDGVIGRPSLWTAEDFSVLRFRLMVKRGPWSRPQASEGEAQHGAFCWIGRIGQGDECLHCG